MRFARFLATATGLLVVTTGCGPGYCDPYYDPYCGYDAPIDYVGVGVDPWGYCSDPFSCGCTDPSMCLSEGASLASTTAATTATCLPSDTTCEARTIGTAVNQALQSVLMPVEALIGLHPTKNGGVTVFGPLDAGPPASSGAPSATFRLSVRRSSGRATWKLEAKRLGSASGWAEVFTGVMIPGRDPRRGRGVLGIDLDALASVNPSAYAGSGKLLGAFDNNGVQKATAYRLVGFSESGSPNSDGLLISSTSPSGHVETTLSLPGAPIVRSSSTTAPLSSTPTDSSATLDAGTPPETMPDPAI